MKRIARPSKITIGLTFIFASLASLGIFKILGTNHGIGPLAPTVSYSNSLTAEEKTYLEQFFAQHPSPTDVTISAETLATRSSSESDFTYDILVPVADFYSSKSSISSIDLETTISPESDTSTSSSTDTIHLISIHDLKPTDKLLAIDNHYYFDDFNQGAQFRTFHLDSPKASEIISTLVSDQNARYQHSDTSTSQTSTIPLPTTDNTLSFAQTGVTALTRAMTTRLNQTGDATAFAANIAPFLSSKDLTHISNEVSFADNCEGGSGTTTLCSDWRMLDVINAISADIVELTGNHNNDYGAENNVATINKYHDLNLQTFGGGLDESSAAMPLLLGVHDPANPSADNIKTKNTRITLLGYNNSTSTKANGQGADSNHPGANIYSEEHAKVDIEAAKANGSFVIVDVQFFECYSYPDEGQEMPSCDAPITNQEDFFKHLIDLGADMVIGTQAHQPQTYELYNGKPIYYGLGNLFFDQTYWPGTTRSLILTHYFVDGQYIQTRLTPTIYDNTYATRMMTDEESEAFLSRLAQSSPKAQNS